ncbi:hypothetical protein V1639_16210 [Pseudarthrobacter sp. J75]|uniref:hypothetical protein n=1 Tax=unclassified Pseudarthrobacter TaxID=2647000 RepID=UPI002E7FFF6A|nr:MULTISPECIES: hypothetical protein [unclassified Pseudarthrobacter]MEE2523580.1 hypothetical protein [Pseudarthrobacter sp. J47]MEE2530562.1 hypothetical protein [Pseudarthrobacter sp. J75]MEE2570015.1 hypothetical protein [Pseudarthrobacter sp. J64]
MTTPESNTNPSASETTSQGATASSTAPEGVKSRLTEAQRAMLASKSRGGGGQAQSVGKSHKPTHASGKKGPVEKKTRW